eukprot:4060290-Pyramimonas_sp.AAC.1
MCYGGAPPVVHAPNVVPSALESDIVVGRGAQGLWGSGKNPAGPLEITQQQSQQFTPYQCEPK